MYMLCALYDTFYVFLHVCMILINTFAERYIWKIVLHTGVPCLALLTHIDQLCQHVATDNSLVFRSTAVLDVVTNTAAVIGISRSNIIPVHNYENEISTDEAKDALALLALRQMLRLSNDFFFEQLDILGK